MPMVKMTTSALGNLIVNDIKSFMIDNANAMTKEDGADVGATVIANTIAYGIAKALASPAFMTALAAGVGPASAGSLIAAALQPMVIEVL